ncbi:unnamed protein product [Adineta steineri]|uniref:NAD(P)(+)--arginine ADP-ribosyltransferase n=1 Tax=Adineta steineri TaxID=433720 RepID=A0A815IBM2_9BILA|nr:unnamed protein product [Adineta steineri]CAF3917910.1 unnamed protein product [Adineta steineri]
MASNLLSNTTEDEVTQHRLRYSDMVEEPQKMLLPIEGYEKMPLVSLMEAIEPLITIVPGIDHKAWVARQNSDNPKDGLTPDQSASIVLYSMEGKSRETNVYFVLNSILRSNKPDRTDKLKSWFLYLKLFITALTRLPSRERTVYRGVKMDLSARFTEGKTFVWWGFSSCTTSMKTLKSEDFLGQKGTRTLFTIECFSGKDIRNHSHYLTEEEILLIAGRQFEVIACLPQPPDLHIIQVKEVEPTFPHLKLESNTISISALTLNPTETPSSRCKVKPYASLFLCKAYEDLRLSQNWHENRKELEIVVEAAIHGIKKEGLELDKQAEGEELAEKLFEKRSGTVEEIWNCCAYLYTIECFLYQKVNEYMRLVKKEDQASIELWHGKTSILGPFALLLNLGFKFNASDKSTYLYRGANMKSDDIENYHTNVGKERIFQAFTSVIRNRDKANEFGNTLMIIHDCVQHIDLSLISEYPEEEEELLPPGLHCRIDRLEFDSKANKHLIYLTTLKRE